MTVLATLFGGISLAVGGNEKKKMDTPSIIKASASSDDEFKFIQVSLSSVRIGFGKY